MNEDVVVWCSQKHQQQGAWHLCALRKHDADTQHYSPRGGFTWGPGRAWDLGIRVASLNY